MTTREATVARGLSLEYLTVFWNSLEALIALVSGFIAGSIALVGFGLDSIVEVSSGGVLLWRLRVDRDIESREHTERLALRLPVAVGAKVTLMVQVALAASVLGLSGQLLVWAKSPALVPARPGMFVELIAA